jgi:hypothetical protein
MPPQPFVLLLNECLLLLFISLRLSPETFGYILVYRLPFFCTTAAFEIIDQFLTEFHVTQTNIFSVDLQ